MTATTTTVTDSAQWRALQKHADECRELHLRELFAADPERADRFSVAIDGVYFDYSKQLVTDETVRLLVALAERAGFAERRRAMFAGEHVNVTEDRPALHVALRAPREPGLVVDGTDVAREVHETLDRMAALADGVRSGAVTGATGRRFELVVNIGIGGSDLGPKTAYEALRRRVPDPFRVRFVSNIDPTEITDVFEDADPQTTLVVVSSKTFTTSETLTNASAAKAWLERGLPGGAVSAHLVGVTNNVAAATGFGVPAERVFGVPEWVGGRYSYDSAVGLALMVGIGPAAFRDMLAGAHAVDEHFREAPLERNIPALMGLLGVWYSDFLDHGSYAVLPYSSELALLPAHLQQLEMESNGKRVTLSGQPVGAHTAPVTWGQPGTNGQHAFYQLLHQGTRVIPADFVAVARPHGALASQHRTLLANAFAQSAALAFGKTAEEVAADGVPAQLVPHRTFPGNRPSSTILLDELTPRTFGQLVTLYEHKVFTQGVVWAINSFDQWGVELGKVLASQVDTVLRGEATAQDQSTDALVRRVRSVDG